MKRRTILIVGSVVCVGLVALVAAYMTGVLVFGDPFPGTWDSGDGKIVIRHTGEGYGFTLIYKGHSNGWSPAKRTGNALTYTGGGTMRKTTFVFQPWSRHLLAHDDVYGSTAVLRKVSGDTTAAPTPAETPGQQF